MLIILQIIVSYPISLLHAAAIIHWYINLKLKLFSTKLFLSLPKGSINLSFATLKNDIKSQFFEFHLEIHSALKFDLPRRIYLFKVNDRKIGTTCEICSKVTIKTPGHVSINTSQVLRYSFSNNPKDFFFNYSSHRRIMNPVSHLKWGALGDLVPFVQFKKRE